MDSGDIHLWVNRDWDPLYLSLIFDVDFNDFSELWESNITDCDIVTALDSMESYCPIVEDITMDDYELCSAVDRNRVSLYF